MRRVRELPGQRRLCWPLALAVRGRDNAGLWPPAPNASAASGTSLPGWLVVLARRPVTALDQLTAGEAADPGPLLRALRGVSGLLGGDPAGHVPAQVMDEVAISAGQALRLGSRSSPEARRSSSRTGGGGWPRC
jgi:hypothetical protein